ncbi:MAG: DUF4129 domain-containing protein [Planctomycetia bacterium]|nr:DUF4129 domain-containing protein [Planctomycetia bacterium]
MTIRIHSLLLLSAVCVFLLTASMVPAQTTSEVSAPGATTAPDTVSNPDATGTALPLTSETKRFPWYSPKAKKLVFIPPAAQKASKVAADKEPKTPPVWLNLLTRIAAVILLTLLAIVIAWATYKLLTRKRLKTEDDRHSERDKLRRLETLLPEVRLEIDHLLDAAENAYAQGDLVHALVFYFSHCLIELDKHRLIHLQRGKTNHDYARELRRCPECLPFYESVMALFERTYYGNYPLDAADFHRVWQARTAFRATLDSLPSNSPAVPVAIVTKMFLPLLCLLLTLQPGCRRSWSEQYVSYLPHYNSDKSINGDALFRDAIADAGYRIKSFDRLPYHSESYDTIVWFRDQGESSVTPEAAQWFSQWLANEPVDTHNDSWMARVTHFLSSGKSHTAQPRQRTLVLVEFGYRADVEFWTEMWAQTPPQHRSWVQGQLRNAKENESLQLLKKSTDELPVELLKRIFEQPTEGIPPATETESPGTQAPVSDSDPFEVPNSPADTSEPVENAEREPASETGTEADANASDEQPLWFIDTPFDEVQECSNLNGSDFWPCQGHSGDVWRVARELTPLPGTDVCVRTGTTPLILHRQEGNGNIYVLAGGGFLLNYPLLRPARLQMAKELVARFSPSGKRVIFFIGEFQAEEGKAEAARSRFALNRFTPFAVLFWQVFLLMIILALWKMPIFGRPRRIPVTRQTDFTRHIDAYARLLRNTRNRHWAQQQIDEYKKQQQSEQGDP